MPLHLHAGTAYDLLLRMAWITKSNICQNMDDFRYDADSEFLVPPRRPISLLPELDQLVP